jgi:hypothetical protein
MNGNNRVGDSAHKSRRRRIEYAEARIAEAKFIGWPALAHSWQATLNSLLQLKS